MLTKNKIVRLIGILLIVMFPLSGNVFSNEVHAQGEIPTLYAEISFDWVDGRNWPLGDYVTLTIEDPDTTLSPDFTDTQIVGTDQLPTYVRFDIWEDGFDLEPGHIVTLTNGPITKTHTALNIEITNVNLDSWYVEGFAPSLGSLMVTAHDPCWENVPVTADMMTGYWKATFACDLNSVEFIHAEMQGSEEAGVSTGFFWSPPPPPAVQVEINHDWVAGWNWPVDHLITLTINGEEIDSQVVHDEPWGTEVNFNSWDTGFEHDLQPGDVVTLEDTVTNVTQTHTALDVRMTKVNYTANTVEGMAAPGSDVYVNAHEPCSQSVGVQADATGYWIAAFECELNTLEHIHLEQYGEDDISFTSFFWNPPKLQVDISQDWVYGWDWLPGTLVSLTIDDPDIPGVENYVDEKIVEDDQTVAFDFPGVYFVEPGHIVTLTDGGVAEIYEVENLEVYEVDTVTDIIKGKAEPGKEIEVTVGSAGWISVPVETNAVTGEWEVDFAGIADLTSDSWGNVRSTTSWSENHTQYWWNASLPTTHEIGFGWQTLNASKYDEIVLRSGWGACTQGLVNAFKKAAHIDITINGMPLFPEGDEALYWGAIEQIELEGCKAAPNGNQASGSAWRYPLGSLEPGIYEVYVHYWLDHPMIDGGDWDGDGKMDKFEGTLVENTIIIIVK